MDEVELTETDLRRWYENELSVLRNRVREAEMALMALMRMSKETQDAPE